MILSIYLTFFWGMYMEVLIPKVEGYKSANLACQDKYSGLPQKLVLRIDAFENGGIMKIQVNQVDCEHVPPKSPLFHVASDDKDAEVAR